MILSYSQTGPIKSGMLLHRQVNTDNNVLDISIVRGKNFELSPLRKKFRGWRGINVKIKYCIYVRWFTPTYNSKSRNSNDFL